MSVNLTLLSGAKQATKQGAKQESAAVKHSKASGDVTMFANALKDASSKDWQFQTIEIDNHSNHTKSNHTKSNHTKSKEQNLNHSNANYKDSSVKLDNRREATGNKSDSRNFDSKRDVNNNFMSNGNNKTSNANGDIYRNSEESSVYDEAKDLFDKESLDSDLKNETPLAVAVFSNHVAIDDTEKSGDSEDAEKLSEEIAEESNDAFSKSNFVSNSDSENSVYNLDDQTTEKNTISTVAGSKELGAGENEMITAPEESNELFNSSSIESSSNESLDSVFEDGFNRVASNETKDIEKKGVSSSSESNLQITSRQNMIQEAQVGLDSSMESQMPVMINAGMNDSNRPRLERANLKEEVAIEELAIVESIKVETISSDSDLGSQIFSGLDNDSESFSGQSESRGEGPKYTEEFLGQEFISGQEIKNSSNSLDLDHNSNLSSLGQKIQSLEIQSLDLQNDNINELGDKKTIQSVAKQIQGAVQNLNSVNAKRITLSLTPESLGRVEIEVNVKAGQINSIEIKAAKPETLQLLETNAKILQETLKEVASSNDASFGFSFLGKGSDGSSNEKREAKEPAQLFSLLGENISKDEVIGVPRTLSGFSS